MYTPMMQQYLQIKADYPDAFLFFRLGDFYELFFEDAVKAAAELEITLTGKSAGGAERIPMCGVPHHSVQGYIETLVARGYKVAICEQMEDARYAKGVVRREVVQLITPGTMVESKVIGEKENNYLVSLTQFPGEQYGLIATDLSTGESQGTLFTGTIEEVLLEAHGYGAKEIVVSSDFPVQTIEKTLEQLHILVSIEDETTISDQQTYLVANIQNEKIKTAFGRMICYITRTQRRSLAHLQPMTQYAHNDFLKIDVYSKRNLELTETIRTKEKTGSLLWLLDKTKTAMGGRLLKQWIDRPLIDRTEIERRLSLVEAFSQNYFVREDVKEHLKEVYDLERLAGKVAFGSVNARELVQLKNSLLQIPGLKDLMGQIDDSIGKLLDPCPELVELLEKSIQEYPPISIKEGDMIKDGYHEQLDEYRYLSKNGKKWLNDLEQQEREITGVKSLKVGYNRVFGYYIEVTKANLDLLPEGRYERKQTLANAERFITQELKEKEAMILGAEEKIIDLEYDLFVQIREEVKRYIKRLQQLAKVVSELDVLQSFSTVSEENHFTKPTFTANREIRVKDGRHPVVEKVLDASRYVPNDCIMDENTHIFLITGPNMSGKSTYMRQVALNSILAQIGCFVPATEAMLPIFDQIFTRIGAADDLISGQSTFMVEMLEANNAITYATENSLILFDEIGRGTSTYDGIALAQAIIEHIHEKIGAKTLFSTHYHELTALETALPALKNIHVRAEEERGKVVFLHKIKEGAADRSYGIHVAELAHMPNSLIKRAKEVLSKLETKEQPTTIRESAQLSLFPEEPTISEEEQAVMEEIKSLNVLEMTPLEAMNTIHVLQQKLK